MSSHATTEYMVGTTVTYYVETRPGSYVETSGVIVFGRKGATDSLLKRAFQERRVQKEYLAIVRGTLRNATIVVSERMANVSH